MPYELHGWRAVRKLIDRGAQLVEVLPREDFVEDHLRGSINLPLREIDADGARRLDRGRPVVVYCWDSA